MKSINEWCTDIHSWATGKGFYDDYEYVMRTLEPGDARHFVTTMFIGQRLSLVHSEVSEILDAVRDGDDAHELEEIADTVIRLFDYAQFRGYALEQAIEAKMDINHSRPHRHGRKVF
jgi:hypothetical protein